MRKISRNRSCGKKAHCARHCSLVRCGENFSADQGQTGAPSIKQMPVRRTRNYWADAK